MGMRVAIMQPYLLPYLGYFQLLHSVDTFVLLDEVAFINRGWINRNQLLVNGTAHLFTVPLAGSSQNKRIQDLRLHPDDRARRKLLATIRQAYRAAPEFERVFPLVSEILISEEADLTTLVLKSLILITTYVGRPVSLVRSSALARPGSATGQARIIAICQQLGATDYVNMAGGAALYAAPDFAAHGIRLRLLQPTLMPYWQGNEAFVPGLSILDVLMHNSPDRTRELFQQGIIL
jgi:hypothetical protein